MRECLRNNEFNQYDLRCPHFHHHLNKTIAFLGNVSSSFSDYHLLSSTFICIPLQILATVPVKG